MDWRQWQQMTPAQQARYVINMRSMLNAIKIANGKPIIPLDRPTI